nr:Dil domain-containing protein [Tanacetum cinerariifolium]
ERKDGAPSKEFDSNLTQSTLGRERELVDTLMKAATEDLGFSQGKPRSLSPSPPKPQQPTSIFGRMTQ